MRQGDKRAVALLYDNYGSAIYGIILRIVGDEMLAKDVMQESFVKIWKNCKQYDTHKGRLFTWLINIARNSAIDAKRSKSFKAQKRTDKIDQFTHGIKDSSQEIKTDHIGIKSMVDNLNPDQKKVIDLVYFGGYTQQEASEALNIPLGTVKTRVKIAIRELKKVFVES